MSLQQVAELVIIGDIAVFMPSVKSERHPQFDRCLIARDFTLNEATYVSLGVASPFTC
jgi:hypothetical protein